MTFATVMVILYAAAAIACFIVALRRYSVQPGYNTFIFLAAGMLFLALTLSGFYSLFNPAP